MITRKIVFIICFAVGAVKAHTHPGQNPPDPIIGKTLYVKHCTKCHGEDGSKGEWGAKNLRKSKLGPEDLFSKIAEGGWVMPKWRKTLSNAEIQAVGDYVKTLRDQ